ncbi:MAG: DUF3800 domain-containing protein [Planctomycetota bacterium]|nr:DUF3800 domain-containing protein [Planctomycetota bacterium]
MRILFIDESGCLGALPVGNSKIQPVFCLAGLIIPQDRISMLTRDWIDLKQRFFPRLCKIGARSWDWQMAEIKGADLRRPFRKGNRRLIRHATGFLDKTIELLESHDSKLVSRTWIKNPGDSFNHRSVYSFSVQALCDSFQAFLLKNNELGLAIADSTMPKQNTIVSHSIFTGRYKQNGDRYSNLIEVPVFGHSDNHAGLQITDIMASALIFPICAYFFAHGRFKNLHIHSRYEQLAKRYTPALQAMEYRHVTAYGLKGGLVVSDPGSKRGSGHLFSQYGSNPHANAVISNLAPAPAAPRTSE